MWDRRRRRTSDIRVCWDTMSNGQEPVSHSLGACSGQSLECDRVYMGDSRWDATLRCRWRQPLSETECYPFFGYGQLLGCDGEMSGS